MKLKSLSIKNYKSFGDYETTIPLSDIGTTLITAPNGSGKSNCVEAISWCLYGESSVSADQVVNWNTKKDCKVGVKFSIGEKNYEVIRYRKHDKHGNSLYIFEEDENISRKGINETQTLILEIIHIPYNVMKSSFLFSTETYVSFLRENASKRLQIIEGVLLLKEINEYYNTTKTILKKTEEEYQKAIKEVEVVEYGIETINSNIQEYKEKAKKDLISLREEKKVKEDFITSLKEKLDKMSSINIQDELDKIKKYKEVLDNNARISQQIKNVSPEEVDVSALNLELDILRNSIDGLKKLDIKKEKELLARINEIKQHNTKISNEIIVLENSIEDSQEHYKVLISSVEKEKEECLKELEKLSSSKCYTCGQSLTGEKTTELVSALNNKIKVFEETIESHIKNIEKIQIEENKRDEKIKELRATLIEEPKAQFSYEQLETINESIAEEEKKYLSLMHKLESWEKTENYIKELKKGLLVVPEQPKYTEEEIHNSNKIFEEIKSAEKEIEIIGEKAKIVYDKSYIETLDKKKEKLEKALAIREKKRGIIEDDRKHYSLLADIFSNKNSGFKKFFIEKVIDIFNEKINFYLPFFFTDDIKIVFDKDLKETIEYKEFQVEFKSFSAGQKTRIDLAIAFSLFGLVKTFFSADVNVIVFDEILDMNLDVEGVNSVMGIIENMATENSVFVISHREEYKERFNKKLMIDQRDGFSVIS